MNSVCSLCKQPVMRNETFIQTKSGHCLDEECYASLKTGTLCWKKEEQTPLLGPESIPVQKRALALNQRQSKPSPYEIEVVVMNPQLEQIHRIANALFLRNECNRLKNLPPTLIHDQITHMHEKIRFLRLSIDPEYATPLSLKLRSIYMQSFWMTLDLGSIGR